MKEQQEEEEEEAKEEEESFHLRRTNEIEFTHDSRRTLATIISQTFLMCTRKREKRRDEKDFSVKRHWAF